jgi:hypothetical protein
MSGREINPVAFLLDTADMGVREFGREFGFSYSAMVALTTGTFSRISPRTLDKLRSMMRQQGFDTSVLRYIYGTDSIEVAFKTWQKEARLANSWVFNVDAAHWARIKGLATTKDRSPVDCFIYATAGTGTRFSKLLKVPPATVLRWATFQTQTMPRTIFEALREIGFEHIEELQNAHDTWATKWGK